MLLFRSPDDEENISNPSLRKKLESHDDCIHAHLFDKVLLTIFTQKYIVKSPSIVFGSAVKCLADQPLADTFELSTKKQDKNLQIPFKGAYPQYLIDQDGVVEDYECTSNGIQDIAYSSYCKPASYSFKGKEENILQKICKTLKEYLPL